MTRVKVLDLDAQAYQRHALHADDRVWVEKNCYIDIWLEVLHALGCDPMAVLPFTVAIDFEGDQWTFFKPPHDELRDLYGIDVQELNCWRTLFDHAVEHLGAGKLISTEADAWWLPDTQGTDYRRQHTKTTIVINDLDPEAGRLGYFHNASYYQLDGEDYARTFRVGAEPDPAFMPLFAELVRVDRVVRRPAAELAQMSRRLWARHIVRRPDDNPVGRFRQRFERDLPWLQERGLDFYHQWAFGTVRQLGAAFELASLGLTWLEQHGAVDGLGDAAAAFDRISNGCKTFILKAARAVNARRAFDPGTILDDVAAAWQTGTDLVAARLGE